MYSREWMAKMRRREARKQKQKSVAAQKGPKPSTRRKRNRRGSCLSSPKRKPRCDRMEPRKAPPPSGRPK